MLHLSPHLIAALGGAAGLGFIALRVLFKMIKLGLLLAAPVLLYLLHGH